jgi:hypothetical protein
MDVIIVAGESHGTLMIPISFLFWGYVAAYVVHILEESLLGENFVEMVRKNFWPAYQWKHFFGFNALLMVLLILSIVFYEVLGGGWIVAPLIFVFLMATNGLWHLGFTLITKKFSPGLVTSILYWMLFYFIFRYSFLQGEIAVSHFVIAAIVGTAMTVLMIGSFGIFKKRFGG